jgi:galactose mutarotase-like enzyme
VSIERNTIDGLDLIELGLPPAGGPGFIGAQLLPARGLMLLQARARLPDGRVVDILAAPSPADAARALDGGPADAHGNASFRFGAAILAPYANRIRGTPVADGRLIATRIAGHPVELPANGGGTAPGAERYAIHGLILVTPVTDLRTEDGPDHAQVTARIAAGDFGVGWPSATTLDIRWELRREALSLRVTARNDGDALLPIGLGWHPYFALPSGRREEARLRVPARARLPVDDYDQVLPTGAVVPVENTPYDFRAPGGVALGRRFLDDCFVELDRTPAGETVCEVLDPPGGHGVRIVASGPRISAVQTYAPPDRPFVVVEPQFNWANPFGAEWGTDRDTGMATLRPGESTDYAVRLELRTP